MRIITATLLSCLIGSLAALEVGETAPSLDQVQWIKGEAPDLSDQVTVVEFWATWCAPCMESIPHLSRLQDKYGEQVAIVGLSDEPITTIEPFVEEQGEQMDYRVGSLSGEARDAWMADMASIPHAIMVDKDGTVLWQGHPMTIDRPLSQAIAGTFDPEQAQRVSQLEQALQQSIERQDLTQIKQVVQALLAEEPAHLQGLFVLRAVAQQENEPERYRSHVENLEAEQVDAVQLASLADLLLTAPDLRYRVLATGVDFARRAREAAPEDGYALTSWAHARYLLGDLEGAVEAAEQATQQLPENEMVSGRLDYYRQAKQLAAEPETTASAR